MAELGLVDLRVGKLEWFRAHRQRASSGPGTRVTKDETKMDLMQMRSQGGSSY